MTQPQEPIPENGEAEPVAPVNPVSPATSSSRDATSVGITTNTDHELDPIMRADQFKNRRRMAWIALYSMLFIAFIAFFWLDPATVDKYDTVFGWIFATLSSIVLGYMGLATWQYNKFIGTRNKDGTS